MRGSAWSTTLAAKEMPPRETRAGGASDPGPHDSRSRRRSCQICASEGLARVLRIEEVPYQIATLWPTREAALAAAVGCVDLTLCRACGFVFNAEFLPENVIFAPGYEISLHHSPTYQDYLEAEARHLVEDQGIRQRVVVEVGCGNGHFLRLLCRIGSNTGFGYDPTLAHPGTERAGESKVTLIGDVFRPETAPERIDLVVTRGVLEAVADPKQLVTQIHAAVESNPDALVYVEVPNASWVFGRHQAWNIYYEHASYFTTDLLPRLFESCGLTTTSCEASYDDGQHIRLEARPGPVATDRLAVGTDRLEETLASYREDYTRTVEEWRRRLRGLRRSGKRVAAWGAGGRGITFLNTVFDDQHESGSTIQFAIDVNPARQGKFVPGTGQQVLAPAALPANAVDAVIITNRTYEAEIRAEAEAFGGSGYDFLVL